MASQDNTAFLERLAHYRNLTLETLVDWLPSKEPQRYMYSLIGEHLSYIGKGLRPAFCLATCQAFGGRIEDALHSAAAIEMLHNAFLVHDDIEDESEFRRNQRTMHMRYGIPMAVNTGDAMQALGMSLLRQNIAILGPRLAWQLFDEFNHMVVVSLEGQAMELGWIRDHQYDVSEEDYLRMTLKKTCWYSFIHPCRIGALIARRGAIDADRFNAFGYYLGAAFQIQDDVLNVVGSREKYGKEIGGDLYEGKRTLMLVHLLQNCAAHEGQRLRDMLAKPRQRRLPREVAWIAELFDHYGSVDFARATAQVLVAAAEDAFAVAFNGIPDCDDKEFIRHSLKFIVERDL